MRKFDYSYLLLVFPVLRICMPWLQYRTRAILVLPFLIAWFGLMVIKQSSMPIKWRIVLRRDFVLVLCLMLFHMLLPAIYGLTGQGRVEFSWYGFVSFLVMNLSLLGIVYVSFIHNKFRELKFLASLVILVMIYEGIMAFLVGGNVEGGAARLVVGMQQHGWDVSSFNRDAQALSDETDIVIGSGFGGYHFIYAYAFLAPAFFYAGCRIRNWKIKAICFITMLANLSCIKNGGLHTPLFVAAIGFLLAIFALLFRWRRILVAFGVIAGLSLIMFIYHPTFFRPLALPLEICASLAVRDVYKSRFMSIADTIRGSKRTYALDRYYLQKRSIDSFLKGNMLIGEGSHADEGGHSMFLDMLAFYGLVGFAVFVGFLVSFLKFQKALGAVYLGRQWLGMVYCYLGAFLFTTVANPVNLCYAQLYIMFPVLALFFPDCPVNESRQIAFDERRALP